MSDGEQTVYNGRYEIHRQVARGGMAEVFLARDQLLDRPVAVKVLFPEFASDPAFVERFRREAQAAANLNHPNIVGVYDWGEESGTYYIVMEFIEGRSLAEVLGTEGPLHPDRGADVCTDVAAALGFAHRNGVVHRDIKPGNVLISPSGQVKVADFGIARAMAAGAEQNLTQTGAVMGTATYFSPEQAQGQPVDPRSDLYSLGVVLYEMVTGRPPFSGDSPVSIAYKHVQETPTPPRNHDVDLPAPLEAVILKLLAKNPANRYPSAEDLRADLRRFREGQPVVAEPIMAAPGGGRADATAALTSVSDARQVYDDGTRIVPAAELPSEHQPPRRTGVFLVVLVVLLLLLAGLLFALARVLGVGDGGGPDVAQVAVPTVVDLTLEEARGALLEAGFEVETVFEDNDLKEEGIVFDQDPAAGEKVDEGSTVTIKVSSGAALAAVPEVVGQQRDDAIARLQQDGFEFRVETRPDEDAPEGEVVSQDPGAGTEAPLGTAVTIVVSEGPPSVVVEDVTGRTAVEAAGVLGGQGFVVEQSDEASNDVDQGRVIRTDPPAGTELDRGDTVRIVVSIGPADVQVPSVVGLLRQTAVEELEGRGFNVQTQTQSIPPTDSRRNDEVLSQTPTGGTSAAPGSTVTIVVSQKEVVPSDDGDE